MTSKKNLPESCLICFEMNGNSGEMEPRIEDGKLISCSYGKTTCTYKDRMFITAINEMLQKMIQAEKYSTAGGMVRKSPKSWKKFKGN